jgi:hypothetical protein
MMLRRLIIRRHFVESENVDSASRLTELTVGGCVGNRTREVNCIPRSGRVRARISRPFAMSPYCLLAHFTRASDEARSCGVRLLHCRND